MSLTKFVEAVINEEEIPSEAAEDVCEQMKKLATAELKRRGITTDLLQDRLGISDAGGGYVEVVNYLAGDFLCHITEKRLSSLCSRLKRNDNIDGCLPREVGHFISELQHKNDEVGRRIWSKLSELHRDLEREEVFSISRETRGYHREFVSGQDIISTSLDPPKGDVQTPQKEVVFEISRKFSAHLLERSNREKCRISLEIKKEVVRLRDCGIQEYQFSELVNPVQEMVRKMWQETWVGETGLLAKDSGHKDEISENDSYIWVSAQDVSRLAESGDYERLRQCIEEKIADLTSESTGRRAQSLREHMEIIWRFILIHSQEQGFSDRASATHRERNPIPSTRFLARELGLNRERAANVRRGLQDFTEECWEEIFKSPLPAPFDGAVPPREDRIDAQSEVTRNALRAAAQRRQQQMDRIAGRTGQSPASGDIFHDGLNKDDDADVEWMVLETKGDEVMLLPVDGLAVSGSKDIDIPFELRGTAQIRCHPELAVQIEAHRLDPSWRTDIMPDFLVDSARVKRARILDGTLRESLMDLDVDGDIDYLDRLEEVKIQSMALSGTSAASSESPIDKAKILRFPDLWRRMSTPSRIAAALALLVPGALSYHWHGQIGAYRADLERVITAPNPIVRELRGTLGIDEIRVPEGSLYVTLEIYVGGEGYERYDLQIIAWESRNKVYHLDNLREHGSALHFNVPTAALPAGVYSIKVNGYHENQAKVVENDLRFHMIYEPSATGDNP